MAKPKRKLTAAEKRAKKKRREEYMTIFVHGKQKRVRRPETIEGMDVDEFIACNADPIWLFQNEMWVELHAYEQEHYLSESKGSPLPEPADINSSEIEDPEVYES